MGSALLRHGCYALWLLLAGCPYSPTHPAISGHLVEERLTSTNVGDTYRILLRLPPEYDTDVNRTFPVIYQLDAVLSGTEEFYVTAGFASELEADHKMPPVIVVGIGYFYDDGPKTGRFRDYTFPVPDPDTHSSLNSAYGFGADSFYAFIRDELIPHVDVGYRTDRKPRTLSGHSLGALFALYSLFRYDSSNTHFDKFLASSPTFDFENGAIFEKEAQLAARTDTLPVRLFVSIGALEGVFQNVYFDTLVDRLDGHNYSGLFLKDIRYNGTDHLGDIDTGYPDGLRFLSGAP